MPWKVKGAIEHSAEPDIVCSLVESPDIFLEVLAKQKIQVLMEEYKSQEWLAYLVGKETEMGDYMVMDISVPPHASAYGASAEAEPFYQPKDCIGVIHSHHSMGAFHSGTDQSYVDKNFPVSVTVARGQNNQLAFDAVHYTKTSCSRFINIKCQVKYLQPKLLFDRAKFLEAAKRNIDKGKRVYVPSEVVSQAAMLGDTPPKGAYLTDGSGRVITGEEYSRLMREVFKD